VSFFLDNEFELQEINLIHKGEFFEVYKVKIGLRWYARKQIVQKYRTDELYIQILKKEFEVGQHIEHPNIVKYLYLNKDNDGWFILTDFIEGIELDKLIFNKTNSPFPTCKSFASLFISDVCSALNYLHNKNIYHGDLSLKNIIYSIPYNKFIILDFGHAVTINYINLGGGTNKYASPESKNSPDIINAASDIYSLGKILQVISEEYNTKYYRKVILKCTQPVQNERIQNIDEILYLVRNPIRTIRVLIICSVLFSLLYGIYLFRFSSKDLTPKKQIDSIKVSTKPNPINSQQLGRNSKKYNNENHLQVKHSVNSIQDSIVQIFSFLNDFDQIIQNHLSEKEMRANRIKCIVNKDKEFNEYININSFSENEIHLLREAYNKKYYNDYIKSDSLINIQILNR
jgi:serine/threonine protein kinase